MLIWLNKIKTGTCLYIGEKGPFFVAVNLVGTATSELHKEAIIQPVLFAPKWGWSEGGIVHITCYVVHVEHGVTGSPQCQPASCTVYTASAHSGQKPKALG